MADIISWNILISKFFHQKTSFNIIACFLEVSISSLNKTPFSIDFNATLFDETLFNETIFDETIFDETIFGETIFDETTEKI